MKLNNYFSKDDTLIYKGIGILLIIVHNYLHWQKGFGLENEDRFKETNVQVFLDNLYPVTWTDTFSAIFGYLGHYGVQIFIFFSAYGLSVQFIKSDKPFKYWQYLTKRLTKLYFLLFFGVVLFLIFYFLINGKMYGKLATIYNFILLATSVSNFTHKTLYAMFVGPFWFFGLMVQLYLIFPLVFNLIKKYNSYIIFVLSFALIYGLYYLDLTTNFSLFGTIIGHLPEIALGIFFAQNKITKPSILVFFVSVVVFIISQFNVYLFPTSFIAITLIIIFLVSNTQKYYSTGLVNILKYVGGMSMTLFIVNGFFRLHPLFKIEDQVLRGERLFLYLILLFIATHFIHKIYLLLVKKLKI